MTKGPNDIPRVQHPERFDLALDAAAALFRKQGYAGTTVREIARAAGMLPGSLHYRFPSKEVLLLALMERAIGRVTMAIREAVQGVQDAGERLRVALRTYLKLLLADDASLHVLLYDWNALQGPEARALQALRESYEGFVDSLLLDAVRAGLARPGVDVKLVREFGLGAMNWVAQWYRPGHGRTPDQIADAFWAYLAFGLLAEERRPEDVDSVMRRLGADEPHTVAVHPAPAPPWTAPARAEPAPQHESHEPQRPAARLGRTTKSTPAPKGRGRTPRS